MGDMRESFDIMKQKRKQEKINNLKNADDSIWNKHTDYHWFAYLANGDKVEYWPSTNKMGIKGRIFSSRSKRGKDVIAMLKANTNA